ncbi:hypothetical protein [Ralstonia condita]|uniref:hypothetical protein n=1 Tax=Ralstonia condita TaxID=3058600 RepID=UPI00292E50AA|nr:hypothetical protein [Ralstonia sp. LMG 7141]
MDLICKVELYQENGHYFAVLVAPEAMCSSTGRNIAEALLNLGRFISDEGLPQRIGLSLHSEERESRSQTAQATVDPRELPGYVPLVRHLLNERFGNVTLRELSDKLGLVGVTPQLLSSSIAGKGARRVRHAIAEALGEAPDVLWPTARH